MADEVKLRSPIRSTSEALIVMCSRALWERRIGSVLLTTADIAVFNASHQFAEHTSQV